MRTYVTCVCPVAYLVLLSYALWQKKMTEVVISIRFDETKEQGTGEQRGVSVTCCQLPKFSSLQDDLPSQQRLTIKVPPKESSTMPLRLKDDLTERTKRGKSVTWNEPSSKIKTEATEDIPTDVGPPLLIGVEGAALISKALELKAEAYERVECIRQALESGSEKDVEDAYASRVGLYSPIALSRAGICRVIVLTLFRYGMSNVRIASHAVNAIHNLRRTATEFGRPGACATAACAGVVKALRAFGTDIQFVSLACNVLRDLARMNPENNEQLGHFGACKVIVQVLKQFHTNGERVSRREWMAMHVRSFACSVISELVKNPQNRALLFQLDTVSVMKTVVRTNEVNDDVLDSCYSALSAVY